VVKGLVRVAAMASPLLLVGGCNQLAGIGPHTFDGGDAAQDGDARLDSHDSRADSRDGGDDDLGDASANDDSGACPLVIGPEYGPAVRRWQAVSWGIYVVPSGYADDNLRDIWEPKHTADMTLGPKTGLFKSAIAHPPPYDQELDEGLARASHPSSGCLDLSHAPVAGEIIVSVVLGPGQDSDVGTSFDSADEGLVIDDGLLPTAKIFRGNELVVESVPPDNKVPPTKYFYPGFTGETHVILNWGQDQHISLPPGSYELQLRIDSDTTASWTTQSVLFVVR
jgi:hypothetical protein